MGSSEGIGLPEGAFNNTLEQFDWFFEDGMNLDVSLPKYKLGIA